MLHTKLRILLAVGFLVGLAVMPGRAAVMTSLADWTAASGGYTTIDFDNLSVLPGSSADYSTSSGLTVSGVTFTGKINGSGYSLQVANNTGADNAGITHEDFGTGAYLEGPQRNPGMSTVYIHVVLPTGTTAVSGNLMALQGVNAYQEPMDIYTSLDGGQNPVETVTTPLTTASLGFFGIVSSTPIQWIDIVPERADSEKVLLDNLRFSPADDPPPAGTPEPLSALLMGSGLLLVGSRLARKRS